MAYLTEIVTAHRRAAAEDPRDLDELGARAASAPRPRGFCQALVDGQGLAVIAEIKRRSPRRGVLDAGLDPGQVARAYEAGGARCLSVLTDAAYFGGAAADLEAARAASPLPILRKDFTVDARDVCDARLMGADAVLLIVAVLGDTELAELAALAQRLELDVLAEVHDEHELERALALPGVMVGVNQRDLETFEVDPARAERLGAAIPPGTVAVAESGIRGPDDALRLAGAGYQAVLVGEALVRAPDRARAVEELGGHPVAPRPGVAAVLGPPGGVAPLRQGTAR